MSSQIFSRFYSKRALLSYALESLLILTLCKIIVICIPFKYWSAKCGKFQCETLRDNVLAYQQTIVNIQRSVKWGARHVPWSSKCLDRALTVQWMLARRKLSSTIYFGMTKNNTKEWLAHAWVRCGDQWMIGYQPKANYTIVGTYALIF
ncbi:MAG: hypothetical protein A3E87_10870 [Gammaproteobacteria bacterium RIFCSPHIGHO2_12_FULL_35_23]|nr:MAG: hypothetical protein A3E87_10870 [Gammaproteobacteria bacterium RIFCSPHIGHO2_12_FULL_35_23]